MKKLNCFSVDWEGPNAVEIRWKKMGSIMELKSDLKALRKLRWKLDLLSGSEFDKQVWKACAEIPMGETLTYSELAEKIKRPKAFRAVANSLGRNPLTVVIPCHRVTAKSGIGGYSCKFGLKAKVHLLNIEKMKADPKASLHQLDYVNQSTN